jgi:hypothetical protein
MYNSAQVRIKKDYPYANVKQRKLYFNYPQLIADRGIICICA